LTEPTDILDSPAAGAQVIRGSAIRTGGYVLGVGLTVVGAAFMTRELGVVDLGRYVVVISLVGIIAGLSEAGLSNIAVREYATRSGSDRDVLIANILGLRLVVGFVGASVAVLFAVLAGYDSTMVIGTVLVGFALLLTTAQQTYVVPLQAALRLGWVSAFDFLRQAVFVGAVLVLVAVDAHLLAFFAISIPVGLLVLVSTLERVRGRVPVLPAFQQREWRRVLGVAAAYSAASAVGTVYVYAAVVVTSLVASESETGYLGASFRIFLVLVAVPSLLITTAFPVLARAARDDRARLQYASQRLFEVAMIVGTWLSLATILGAGFAIDVIAGDDFGPAKNVLRIYALAVAAAFVALTWGFALLSLRRHGVVLVAAGSALVISVTTALVFVPIFGAEGGALATLIAEAAVASFYGIVLFTGRDALRLELGIVPRVAAATIAAAALGALLELPDSAEVALATIAYGVVLAFLGGIPRELLEAFGPARRQRAA
jgi:O-antigen/teichoic acid export membrane protein